MHSIRKFTERARRWWVDRLDPNLEDFKAAYIQIDQVSGYLKSPMQERWFFNAARNAPEGAVIVEIGSFLGRSTVSFALGCKGTSKHVYAIDLFEGDGDMYGQGDFQQQFRGNVRRCGVESYVTDIRSHSLTVAQSWTRPIDILFIDGSHEYEDVKADFHAFYPHVKRNGIIAFHDIKGKWDGVIRYWNEVQRSGYLSRFGTVSSLGFGYKI
ncbi:MAG: class I SAM-dependent methyltransferase [Cyclobacteriaceae bacterium]|nr:class I SAM-dependent methyltransferase [Cyclobacteriaceae bacterium]